MAPPSLQDVQLYREPMVPVPIVWETFIAWLDPMVQLYITGLTFVTPSIVTGRREGSVATVTAATGNPGLRSEEHTSELQSQSNLVCRLLPAKKNYTDCRYCTC